MQNRKNYYFILSLMVALLSASAQAQQVPLYKWQSFLPYRFAYDACPMGSDVLVASEVGIYRRNLSSGEVHTYSKVNGMGDMQARQVAYSAGTNMAVIGYANGNIDLLQDEEFHQIPYLKELNTSGDKTIYDIITHGANAFLATGQGIIVLNLNKKEIRETYKLGPANNTYSVRGVAIQGNDIYAATNNGLYRANLNNPAIQLFSSWTLLGSPLSLKGVASFDQQVYTLDQNRAYVLIQDTLHPFYQSDSSAMVVISSTSSNLYVGEFFINEATGNYYARTRAFNNQQQLEGTINGGNPASVIEGLNGQIYQADKWEGLKTIAPNFQVTSRFAPPGPNGQMGFDMMAESGTLWIAHGGYNDKMEFYNNREGMSAYIDGEWKIFSNSFLGTNDPVDISVIARQSSDAPVYAASFHNGLYTISADGSSSTLLNDTSKLGVTILNGYPIIKTSGLAFDQNGNLWVTLFGARYELACKTPENDWHRISVPINRPTYIYNASKILVDDQNQKWYLATLGGGVMVYDDNNSPENILDDRYKLLTAGKGFGNLPSNTVLSLVKDLDGAIWIGTENGIGIVNCPGDVLNNECEAEIRIVQFDQFAGYLFEGKAIRSMAVDGANRKWVGTNDGVWLLSEEGDEIIERFTLENSPLPSNNIIDIEVDPSTGMVYFGTDLGVVGYRSDAPKGTENMEQILVFPNPVKSNYRGPITISGLTSNADVSITDISGKLVHKGRSKGGQFVWNGTDYTGRRPQSGVYLVFAGSDDGTQRNVGKIAFME